MSFDDPKFKIGDKVIVINKNYSVFRLENSKSHYLQTGIVIENDYAPFIKFNDPNLNKGGNSNGTAYSISEEYLEYEEIFNSPLYKALNENE